MSCCSHCEATDAQFGPAAARRDLDRYRRRGPDRTTKLILEGIRAEDGRFRRLLDVGAGIGVLHHELLGGEVERATHVDASTAYVAAAREEDERRGRAADVEYVVGDAADVVRDLVPADVVTLDRVICCYPDWEGLVGRTAAKATRLYAFSMPHDRWYLRAVVGAINLTRWISGSAFRAFVHPVTGVERLLEARGFRRVRLRKTLVWHVAVYAAASSAEGPGVDPPARRGVALGEFESARRHRNPG